MTAIARIETLTVTWIEDSAEFDRLQPEWENLVAQSGVTSPFLAWPWIQTWWRSFRGNSRLFVLVCRDADARLVGVAPLLIATRKAFGSVPVRVVEFLGNRGSAICTDHLDFITSTEHQESITRELLKVLLQQSSHWDMLSLESIADTSAIPALLDELGVNRHGTLTYGQEEVCPWIDLPETWDGFVDAMKREHKSLISNLRRKRNRLNANHKVEFFAGDAVGDPNKHVETLSELHRMARMRQGGEGNFALPDYRAFHDQVVREMDAEDRLYLARLDIDGQPAAAWYGFFVSPVLSYYQSGFDTNYVKEGVGDVLLGMILEDAITRLGARGFDFLRGTEEYKFRWTRHTHTDRTILYWSGSTRARMAHADFGLRRRASAWKRKWQEARKSKQPAKESVSEKAADS